MLNEELENQILESKLTYLNGYLDALAMICSYSVVGMRFKLFRYNFYGGNIENAIQFNSFELFGVHENDWKTEIKLIKNWEYRLKEEFYSNIIKRRIPIEYSRQEDNFDIRENDLSTNLVQSIKNAINYFIDILKKEFSNETISVYELIVTNKRHYRIVGIDIIFEIDETKLILLQLLGSD